MSEPGDIVRKTKPAGSGVRDLSHVAQASPPDDGGPHAGALLDQRCVVARSGE
jgi:hypothetical protein